MQSGKPGFRKRALTLYGKTTGIKAASSMKLCRKAGVNMDTPDRMAFPARAIAGKRLRCAGPVA